MAEPIRVVIVDDHDLYRRSMAMVIGLDSSIVVVGDAGSGEAALRVVADTSPDVVLSDVRMPGMGGIEAARALAESHPGVIVLMMSMSDEEADLFEAIRAGASGYLLKDLPAEEVAGAIVRAHEGDAFISPAIASRILGEIIRKGATDPSVAPDDEEVTVLRELGRGRSGAALAEAMGRPRGAVNALIWSAVAKFRGRPPSD